MEHASAQVRVASSLSTPPKAFYTNVNPRTWTVSVISRGLMLEESGCKEIRSFLKQEMGRRHLIGSTLNTPHNQAKLGETFKQLESAFPRVFTSDIPREWLNNCEQGMATKINYTHAQVCKRRRLNRQPASAENIEPVTQPCTFDRASFYVQSKRTMTDTLISPHDIIKNKRPMRVAANDIDFGIFKDMLKEDKVYDATRDRIMCRIGNKDIEINHSRKFKVAALSMYERGQDPISFIVEECQAGKCAFSLDVHHCLCADSPAASCKGESGEGEENTWGDMTARIDHCGAAAYLHPEISQTFIL